MKAYRRLCNGQLWDRATTPICLIATRRLSSNTMLTMNSTFHDSIPEVLVDMERKKSERQMKKHRTHSKILIDCFQIYRDRCGDTPVPPSFVIPSDDDSWPDEAWGLKLGTAAEISRKGNTFRYTRDELIAIGFVFGVNKVTSCFHLFSVGLLRYQELHGDMLVPSTFVIPYQCAEWRDDLWGMKLGAAVNGARGGRMYKDKKAELLTLGFDYNPQSISYGYDLVRTALIRYKELNNDMLVPVAFVVPEQNDAWPVHMGGVKLGRCVSSIRSLFSFKDNRKELELLGFDFNKQSVAHGFDLIFKALCLFKEIKGHIRVRSGFVVPDNSTDWPEMMWGLRLGQSVTNIRTRNMYKNNREELESIGFDLKPQKKIFGLHLTKEALIRYRQLNGHLKVPYTYVIAMENENFHEHLWGMNLGGAVKAIRNGTRYRNNRKELEHLGLYIPDLDDHASRRSAVGGHQKVLEQQDRKDKEMTGRKPMQMNVVVIENIGMIGNSVVSNNIRRVEIEPVIVSQPLIYYKEQQYD